MAREGIFTVATVVAHQHQIRHESAEEKDSTFLDMFPKREGKAWKSISSANMLS